MSSSGNFSKNILKLFLISTYHLKDLTDDFCVYKFQVWLERDLSPRLIAHETTALPTCIYHYHSEKQTAVFITLFYFNVLYKMYLPFYRLIYSVLSSFLKEYFNEIVEHVFIYLQRSCDHILPWYLSTSLFNEISKNDIMMHDFLKSPCLPLFNYHNLVFIVDEILTCVVNQTIWTP